MAGFHGGTQLGSGLIDAAVDLLHGKALPDHTRGTGQDLVGRTSDHPGQFERHLVGVAFSRLTETGIGIAAVYDDRFGGLFLYHAHGPLKGMAFHKIFCEDTACFRTGFGKDDR